MAARLTQVQKSLAFRLHKQGLDQREIARQICCSSSMISIMLREKASGVGVAPTWTPRAGRLTIDDREQILLGARANDSMSAIARRIGRSPSTVTREVNANGGAEDYVAWRAQLRAQECARRPKPGKLVRGPLQREVTKRLEQFWSPQEIARRLPLNYPDDSTMRVSHETIYQSLFVQGRGELRRELARCLRAGKASRRSPLNVDGRGHIRSTRRGRRSRRARPLGGRPHRGCRGQERGGHVGGTNQSAHLVVAPPRRKRSRQRRDRHAQGHQDSPR